MPKLDRDVYTAAEVHEIQKLLRQRRGAKRQRPQVALPHQAAPPIVNTNPITEAATLYPPTRNNDPQTILVQALILRAGTVCYVRDPNTPAHLPKEYIGVRLLEDLPIEVSGLSHRFAKVKRGARYRTANVLKLERME